MKMSSNTGLVPLRFLRDHRGNIAGEVVGFRPHQAVRLVNLKIAEAVAPEGGGEEVATVEETRVVETPFAEREQVEIPEGWSGQHTLQRLQLASRIAGRTVTHEADAETLIRNEIARRESYRLPEERGARPAPEPSRKSASKGRK